MGGSSGMQMQHLSSAVAETKASSSGAEFVPPFFFPLELTIKLKAFSKLGSNSSRFCEIALLS